MAFWMEVMAEPEPVELVLEDLLRIVEAERLQVSVPAQCTECGNRAQYFKTFGCSISCSLAA